MALKSITLQENGSRGHHKFTLVVNEDNTINNKSIVSFQLKLSPIQTGWDWNTWGDRITYNVSIDGNNYDGNIPEYNGSSTVTLVSDTIEIEHKPDGTKTIPISFNINDTTGQTYTCGNASDSGELKLTDLHKPPVLNIGSMTEIGSIVPSATSIVNHLSIKKLPFTYTAYDSATISYIEVKINGNNYPATYTLENEESEESENYITLNFQDNPILVDATSLLIEVKLIDNKNGVSNQGIALDENYINYKTPNLITTSSSVKRNGQLSGKVLLNLVGTFFNQAIFGTTNNVSLKFKYWQSGTTESQTYFDIPASAITINGNNISISKWSMTKNGTLIQDVNKSYAYNFKVKATDSFGKNSEITLICTKGEWLMAKFKDRVDFFKITIKGNNIVESGSNENGSWTKYYDGTMIIRQTKTHTITGWNGDGNMYRSNLGTLPDFPVDFIEPPIISLTLTNAFKLIVSGQEGTPTNHRALDYNGAPAIIGVHCATQKNDANDVKLHLIAIGKWK